ncbi:MAG: M14 family metallopeptidase [Candidatus Eremiobacterota bacterium]
MNINQRNNQLYSFTDTKGTEKNVHPERNDIARDIDKNGNFLLEEGEIKDYLVKEDILRDPQKFDVDEQQIKDDFKLILQNRPLPQKGAYHSYEQVISDLKGLETKYPDLVKTVSIGKTAEGRDIMAVKISKGAGGDTGNKTGFLITGCHHAREWMTVECPLYMAKELAAGYGTDEQVKKRLDNAEVWIVPVVNPDGYEYSRNNYSYWRKNREPIKNTDIPSQIASHMKADKDGVVSYGVDLNRNYYDGNPDHIEYYRPKGDTPESTYDDYSSTSDDPGDDTYRGIKGGSEKEVQALLGLWMNKKNIKGIVNHHSYGKKIMYPWGVSKEAAPNKKIYEEITRNMGNAIKDDKYTVMQSSGLYPASGDPDDFASLNDRYSVTIEIGRSFQPNESEIDPTNKRIYSANMAFLDWLINNKKSQEET